jgi:hypothetical protein
MRHSFTREISSIQLLSH